MCDCGYAFIDDHGQPLNRYLSAKRLNDRIIDQLIGMCKMTISDGIVTAQEAQYLAQWLETNKSITSVWPANILTERIREMLADNVIDEEERKELFEILSSTTGGSQPVNMSTTLPLDKQEPEIFFNDKQFCFTGKFVYGTRKQCESEVTERGGWCNSNPTQKTDYLVIGLIGSTDWIHSTHGRKIEYAVELKNKDFPIAIVSEEHWTKYLDS